MSDTTLAVEYARAQVGKPYQFGAAGPGAFDCSGLVMRSLEQIGLVLPHQSGQQAQWFKDRGLLVPNTAANRQRLTPASVAFYYGQLEFTASITHCALYIGPGRTGLRIVVAAVDEQYGVCRQWMNRWHLAPVGFGLVD